MTATLRWNRLEVQADGDAAFKADVEENFAKLLKLPFEHLEVDCARCTNLGESAFKVIGPHLADAAGKKRLTVRITEELASYFQGTGLSSLVTVSLVDHMLGPIKTVDDDKPDFSDLAPDEDEPVKDETHPPGDDMHQTKIQTRAANGGLVDEEDGHAYLIGDEIVIGREPPSEPVFQIPTISKRHFRVYRQGPGYFIEDMRSTNGTYLNGNPLTQPQPLGENDEVVVAITLKHPDGAKRFKFTLKA